MECRLLLGDCLDRMSELEDDSIDLVLADPPYGTTACKWDSIIPLEPMWEHLKRISKKNAATVMTACQPFTTTLIASNMKMFKYCWYWNKKLPRNHLNAKKQPLRVIEDAAVFYAAQPIYNPIMTAGQHKVAHTVYSTDGSGKTVYGAETRDTRYDSSIRYPNGLIEIGTANQIGKVHPTQKPVALMEYMIKTYTNEGDTVLDFAMGSGTTGVACKNLNRNFIGIEKDPSYFEIASKRISNAT